MRNSNFLNIKMVIAMLWLLIPSMILVCWIFQQSINAYWQQTYHKNSPLLHLEKYPLWNKGTVLFNRINNMQHKIRQIFWDEGEDWSEYYNHQILMSTKSLSVHDKNDVRKNSKQSITVMPQKIIQKGKDENSFDEKESITSQTFADISLFSLKSNQQVFFAGDSLMQGVAPHIQSALSKYHQIKSINLSKQSTGLTYPGFFNWNETIDTTLNQFKDIALIVIFLGANDPWDMPSPEGGKYIKFQTSEWEAIYRQRVANILSLAKQKNIPVIWLEVPNMKKDKLNQSIHYLNQLYETEVKASGNLFLTTNQLLGMQSSEYQDYIEKNDSKVKVRSGDGIHFTPRGQKIIAERIMSLLRISH